MAQQTLTNRTALLVMDVQVGIVERISGDADFLSRLGGAITAARRAAMPIIYVVVTFRDGYPEVSPRNRSFSVLKSGGRRMAESDAGTAIHSAVAPEEGDVVVTKRRVGAFSGSDLEIVLRSQGVNSLVLMGVATSGVVLSTVRAAADMDYQITVLSDCCADGDALVQDVLMTRVFPRQAEVLTAEEWRAGLSSQCQL